MKKRPKPLEVLKSALFGGLCVGAVTPAILLPHITGGQAPLIPLSKIDDKVRRILRQIVSFGFLDRPQQDTSIPVNDPRSKARAIDVAREGYCPSEK